MPDSERVDPKTVLAAIRIPVVPAVLQAVIDAVNNPATTSTQLEELVLRDPGLSSQILKMVNSAFFSLRVKVTSISQGIVLLGYATIRSMASSLVMLETVGNMEGVDEAYLKKVWDRSVLCSGVVRLMTARRSKEIQAQLFLASLVHDVGHLILSCHFGRDYRLLIKENTFPHPHEEVKKVGTDHAEVGAELLTQWGFNPMVIELVRNHHRTPCPVEVELFVELLRVGDLLADLTQVGRSLDSLKADLRMKDLRTSLPKIGVSWEELIQWEGKIFA